MEKKSPLYPEDALILAPLSGYTDLPYRRAARSGGCRYAFTEMVDAAALTYARKRSEGMLLRGAEEEFLGVQLVGSDPEYLRRAVDVVNEYEFDLLDFNLGCPVPKVSKKGAGAELGRHLDAALLGLPVLAAGIPTLMEAREGKDLVVTPRALDSVIAHGAALLGAAINRALQPRLTVNQLCWLAGQ